MAPRHVAFIMDGNRRFSKRLMRQPWKGHEWGRDKFEEVLNWCYDRDITEVTVYAFSMQNFNRPEKEFTYLMKLLEETIDDLLADSSPLAERGVRVRVIGRKHLLPESLQEAIAKLEKSTAQHSERFLNIALAYGGREELVDAMRSLAKEVAAGSLAAEDIDDATLREELYLADEPDLIIRTGGDHRTSNFLVWQSAYSEWCFVNSLWPEFSEEELERCLKDFAQRERRYGR